MPLIVSLPPESVSEFIAALGRAGIPVFQYGPEEVLAEVAELEAR